MLISEPDIAGPHLRRCRAVRSRQTAQGILTYLNRCQFYAISRVRRRSSQDGPQAFSLDKPYRRVELFSLNSAFWDRGITL